MTDEEFQEVVNQVLGDPMAEQRARTKALVDAYGPDLAQKIIAKELIDSWGPFADGGEEIYSALASLCAKQNVDEYKAEKRD